MKVFAVRPNENWIIDRVVQEWRNVAPDISCKTLNEADIIWLASGWTWRQIPTDVLKQKKVIVSVHHIVPEKFNRSSLAAFLNRDKYVDQYHVPCEITKAFVSKLTKKPINVVGYWYNPDIWNPLPQLDCRSDLGLPKDAYIIGSFQRDTEGSDLISPKLEKGPDIFVDFVKNFKKENKFVLLGGFRRQYVMSELDKNNIRYKFIKMAPFDILNKMYCSSDLYVVSSRCEGGPQAILEASATKTAIISTNVGMASAVLTKNNVFNTLATNYEPTFADIQYNYESVQNFRLTEQAKKYKDMFTNLMVVK